MCGFIERFLALYAAKPRTHPHRPLLIFQLRARLWVMVCRMDCTGLDWAGCSSSMPLPIHKSCAFWGSAFIKFSHTWLSTATGWKMRFSKNQTPVGGDTPKRQKCKENLQMLPAGVSQPFQYGTTMTLRPGSQSVIQSTSHSAIQSVTQLVIHSLAHTWLTRGVGLVWR